MRRGRLCTYEQGRHLWAEWTLNTEVLSAEIARVEASTAGEGHVFRGSAVNISV